MNHLGPPPILSSMVTPSSSHMLATPSGMINYTMSGLPGSTSVVPSVATAMVPHMAMPVSALALPTGAIQAMSMPTMPGGHHFVPTTGIPTSLVQGSGQQAFPGMNFLNPIAPKQDLSIGLQASPLSLTVSSVAQNQSSVENGQNVLSNTNLSTVTTASNTLSKDHRSTVSIAGLGLVQDLSVAQHTQDQAALQQQHAQQQQQQQQHAQQPASQQLVSQAQQLVSQSQQQLASQAEQLVSQAQQQQQQLASQATQHAAHTGQQLLQSQVTQPLVQPGLSQHGLVVASLPNQTELPAPPKKKKKKSKKKSIPTSLTPSTSRIPESLKPVNYQPHCEERDLDAFMAYQKLCNTHMDLKAKLHLLYNSRHSCQICQREFKGFCRLKRHLQTHAAFKPYKCEVCNKRFYNVSKLKRHSLVHSGLKPYKCPLCDSALSRREHLKRHMLTHSEERPYRCSTCDYSSRRLDGVHKHIRSKHMTEGEAKPMYIRPQVFDLLASSIPMSGKPPAAEEEAEGDNKDPLMDKNFLQLMIGNIKFSQLLTAASTAAASNVLASNKTGEKKAKKKKVPTATLR